MLTCPALIQDGQVSLVNRVSTWQDYHHTQLGEHNTQVSTVLSQMVKHRPLSSSNFWTFSRKLENWPKILQMSSKIQMIQADKFILPQNKAKWGHIRMLNGNEHKARFQYVQQLWLSMISISKYSIMKSYHSIFEVLDTKQRKLKVTPLICQH